jgi:hypothetical protein
MNTILDLLGSYLIGGLILLGLTGFVISLTSQSQEKRITEINQKSLSNIGEIISFDMNRLGYRVSSGSKITKLTNSSLSFLADLDNNGTVDTIEYYMITPKDFVRRVGVPQNSSWHQEVHSFNIKGFDSTGTETYTINKVKSVLIEMSLSDNAFTEEIRSVWSRRFYPRNL